MITNESWVKQSHLRINESGVKQSRVKMNHVERIPYKYIDELCVKQLHVKRNNNESYDAGVKL